jgi:hypothetical protein
VVVWSIAAMKKPMRAQSSVAVRSNVFDASSRECLRAA